MRRCHIFLLFVIFLDYSLLFVMMFTRGEAMYFLNHWYAFYFMDIVNFVSNCVIFFIWFPENENQIYDSFFFVLGKVFNIYISCADDNYGFLLFYFLTDKDIDLQSDNLISNPNSNCSLILELWASWLASLSLSFSSVANEDDIKLTSYSCYEK